MTTVARKLTSRASSGALGSPIPSSDSPADRSGHSELLFQPQDWPTVNPSGELENLINAAGRTKHEMPKYTRMVDLGSRKGCAGAGVVTDGSERCSREGDPSDADMDSKGGDEDTIGRPEWEYRGVGLVDRGVGARGVVDRIPDESERGRLPPKLRREE